MFCAPELIFGGTSGIRSRFHVLRSQILFRWCGGRRVPFSCFTLPDLFLTIPMASGPVFMFCVPVLIFDGTEGVGFHFHVFSPGHVFGGAEGVGSSFHGLRSLTCFRWYQGRRVSFSCFALPDTFSTVQMPSVPVFIFCAFRLVFCGSLRFGSRFHVLRPRTRFRRYRGRRVTF
jgi:hypothetical protein